ncbi:ribonuclease H, partial [Trifolium pratense]
MNWSRQYRVSVTAALINLLNTIWFVRNQVRFNNKLISWKSAIPMIIANTSLSGNITNKVSSSSIRDFTILKHFKVKIHHPRPPVIKEIVWHPPLLNWTKCNIDGASKGNPGLSACGGVFRNNASDSASVVLAVSNPNKHVTWSLRNRWQNAMELLKQINGIIT